MGNAQAMQCPRKVADAQPTMPHCTSIPSIPLSGNIRRQVVYGFPPCHRIHWSHSSPESRPFFCLKTLPGQLREGRGGLPLTTLCYVTPHSFHIPKANWGLGDERQLKMGDKTCQS